MILLVLDVTFVYNSLQCPKFLSPRQTRVAFLLIAAAGIGMVFFGAHIETLLLLIIL